MKSKKKARMGRPPKAGAKRYSIRITDAVANYYRQRGAGNLTLGIERNAGAGHTGTSRVCCVLK